MKVIKYDYIEEGRTKPLSLQVSDEDAKRLDKGEYVNMQKYIDEALAREKKKEA